MSQSAVKTMNEAVQGRVTKALRGGPVAVDARGTLYWTVNAEVRYAAVGAGAVHDAVDKALADEQAK